MASILVLGAAWIAATEKVSTAITATARRIRKNHVPKHSLKGGPFFHGPSLAGGGVDYGLMSFYRFSRSASDDCEGKGDENESVLHGRIPSLIISACPVLRRRAVTKITEFSFQTSHFVSVRDLPGFAFRAHGAELRQATGTAVAATHMTAGDPDGIIQASMVD